MEKLKIAVIGVGRLGLQHAKNVAHRISNTELVAICDIRLDYANSVADSLGVKKVFADYEKMLETPEIDAVLIANIPQEHCACIQAACAAKKHIYCEKPTGMSIEELDLIDEAIAGNPGKVVQVGFVRRFDRSYKDAMQRVKHGDIGKVIKVRSVSRDPSCQKDDFIRLGPTLGGMFFDMSVHDLDIVRWFAGSEVESVYAIGGIYEFTEFANFDDIDNCSVMLKFKNGVMAQVECSKNASCGYDVWVEVVGTKGSIMINPGTTSFVTQKDEYGLRNTCQPWFRERFEEAYEREVFDFANAALKGGKSLMDATDARRAVEMAYMSKKSFDDGIVVYNK